ncbi:MAG: T9SS type A sorting domain-containing protein [Bacteroidota bacterium]
MKKIIQALAAFMCWQLTISQPINRAEYYLDNQDPGYGLATPIPISNPASPLEINASLLLSNISPGFHSLHVRCRNANSWSDTHSRSFYVREIPQNNQEQAKIIAAEYFFGSRDPGYGQGNSLNIGTSTQEIKVNGVIDLSSLDPGFHQLSVRFKQELGGWSTTERRFFFIQDSSLNAKLSELNYEIRQNGNPLFSASIPLSSNQHTVELQFDANTATLASGVYEFCIIAEDEAGQSSTQACRIFEVDGNATSIDNPLDKYLKVYPNPARDWVQIEVESRPILQYSLSGADGQILLRKKPSSRIQEDRFNMATLPEGIYFLSIELPGVVLIKPILKVN